MSVIGISARTRPARGFSLVELLVVIAVIALLLGILIPAISGVRVRAREAASLALMTDLSGAIRKFEQDNGRLPGYFDAREMGQQSNGGAGVDPGRGLTSMENAMLELTGGIAPDQDLGDLSGARIRVGPYKSSDERDVVVDLNLIGSVSGSGAYFTPDGDRYFPVAEQAVDDERGANLLPDLVDSFDNPILLWMQTPSVSGTYLIDPDVTPGPGEVRFAFDNALEGGPNDSFDTKNRALFYIAQNEGWLRSIQNGIAGSSYLGTASISPGDINRSSAMATLLGSPTFPNEQDIKGFNEGSVQLDQIRPGAARGRFVIHGMGPDGVPMEGDVLNASTGDEPAFGSPVTPYGRTFDPDLGGDLMNDFNDLLVGGGN